MNYFYCSEDGIDLKVGGLYFETFNGDGEQPGYSNFYFDTPWGFYRLEMNVKRIKFLKLYFI
jgi:hypothetical protein